MNSSFCNICNKLVPSNRVERGGKVYLTKDCATCGRSEGLISNDATRAARKCALDTYVERSQEGCDLKCASCARHHNPEFTFVSVTNRCHMNCPICVYNVRGMGFEFEPPMEYFDRIFRHLAGLPKPPIVCLFGGEPTVRKDLFDIIKLSRSHGLHTRIFTNGLRLANEEYCRDLLRTRVEIMFSYDGNNVDTYRTLRGNAKALEMKRKALDNIAKHAGELRNKITLAVVLAKGLNESELPSLLEFCHERRDIIGAVFLMPLAHMWDNDKWRYDPPSVTTEDVERLVEAAVPGNRLEFLPRGVMQELAEALATMGRDVSVNVSAHPNCESVYQLRSDGKQWLPWAHYLKTSESETARALLQLNQRRTDRVQRWRSSLGGHVLGAMRLKKAALATMGYAELGSLLVRRVRFGRLVKGSGAGKLYHAAMATLELALGRKSRDVRRHTNAQEGLGIVVLPLEEQSVLETERLERCPSGHVYLDPRENKVIFVPACAWMLHSRTVLRSIADYYAPRDGDRTGRCPPAKAESVTGNVP